MIQQSICIIHGSDQRNNPYSSGIQISLPWNSYRETHALQHVYVLVYSWSNKFKYTVYATKRKKNNIIATGTSNNINRGRGLSTIAFYDAH